MLGHEISGRVEETGPGDTVAVVAAGGIGPNIVQMAAAHGAERIVTVDIKDEELELARRMGATDTVNSLHEDPDQSVRALTDGHGVDVAFEVSGSVPTVRTAVDLVDDGGRVLLVGTAPAGVEAQIDIAHVLRRKIRTLGSDGARASQDMPAAPDPVAEGKTALDDLRADAYAFADADRLPGRRRPAHPRASRGHRGRRGLTGPRVPGATAEPDGFIAPRQ